MRIEGKVALVTGAGRRLGRAIALAIAGRGGRVAVHYHSSESGAAETVNEIRAAGGVAESLRADQGNPEEIARAVAEVEKRLGPVDILVNSAAIFERTPFPEADIDSWDRHMSVNLRGPYLFARAVAPGMRQRGAGKIVNMVDVAAERPWPGYLAYSVSKAGLIALTRGLARALAPAVQVNGVAPGVVLPPEDWSAEELAAALKLTPMKRAGTPQDVVEAVLFLIEGPDYIAGAILPVDGGQLAR